MTRQEAFERAVRWFDSPILTRVMQFVAIASLILAMFVGLRQFQLTNCLADWQDANVAIAQQRNAAAESDRKALDTLVSAIVNARSLPAAQARATVDNALDTYLRTRAYADGQRAASPLQSAPSVSCR